jgi:hypothetical protein
MLGIATNEAATQASGTARQGVLTVRRALRVGVAASAYHGVVLGSTYFLPGPDRGIGRGTPRPKVIFNGGDPSGVVSKIRWTTWGGKAAIGYGLNPIFKPGGGYYATPARIELKAVDIGRCYKGSPQSYTKPVARETVRPRDRWEAGSCGVARRPSAPGTSAGLRHTLTVALPRVDPGGPLAFVVSPSERGTW